MENEKVEYVSNETNNQQEENKKNFLNVVNDTLISIGNVVIDFIKKYWFYIAIVIVIALAILARVPLYTKRTGDYNTFLSKWYQDMVDNGIAQFLAKGDGDYTPTYMYILAIFAVFKIPAGESDAYLYALKTVSVVFEFLTAGIVFITSKSILGKNNVITFAGICVALFAPTIVFNGAFWGQCDSIFVFFVALSVMLLLIDKQLLASIAFGVAFSFKLQSIFFLPVLGILFLLKKYKFRYFFVIPIVYIIIMIPAMICGRSFASCMGVYFNQTDEYPYLYMNAPNIYAYVYKTITTNISVKTHLIPAATWIGLSVIGITAVFTFVRFKDEEITLDRIIAIAYLFAVLAPYVLPKMHDRYFYLADVMAILYLISKPKKWYIPSLTLAASFTGYIVYLFNTYILDDRHINLRIGATIMLAGLILLMIDVFKRDNKPEENLQAQAQ